MSKKGESFYSSVSKHTTKDEKNNRDDAGVSIPSLNDNSNPQQGAGGILANAISRSNARPTTEGRKELAPQQRRPTLLIPPTVKCTRKLFVGGLPSNVTNVELQAFFEEYGKVLDSVVMYDYITSNSRGFGFVTFEDEAVCNNLIRMGRLEMKGKMVEIKPAEPKGKVTPLNAYARGHGNVVPPSVSCDDLSSMAMEPSPKFTPAPIINDPSLAVTIMPTYGPLQTSHPSGAYTGTDPSLYCNGGLSTPASLTGAAPVLPLIGTYYADPMMPFLPQFAPYYPYYPTHMNPYEELHPNPSTTCSDGVFGYGYGHSPAIDSEK